MPIKEKLKEHLNNLKILTDEEVQLIVEKTIIDAYKKDTVLLREGQISNKCYMVVEGCVREYSIVDGEEKTSAFYTEGDKITSYSSEGKGIPSRHYLQCTEDCILTISNQSFEEELRKLIPRLDAIIQEVAKEELGKAKDKWSDFISSSPEERYINLLKNKPTLFNRVPLHQIASYLGVKPESLSRIRKRIHVKANGMVHPESPEKF